MKGFLKPVILLALPILFAQLIEGLYPFINTLIAGREGAISLAAAGLVFSSFLALMGFAWGTITSVGVETAHRVGGNKNASTHQVIHAGLTLSFILGLPIMLIFAYSEPILSFLGQDKAVALAATHYFQGLMWGVPADIAKFAVYQYLIAYDRPKIAVWVHLMCLPILVTLNLFLMETWGMYGLGIGTSITYWIAFFAMLFACWCDKELRSVFGHHYSLHKTIEQIRELIKIGVPIGAMFCIEIALFAVIAFVMGYLGNAVLAAHQVTMHILGLVILFAYGLAESVMILVGKAAGSGSMEDCLPITKAGLAWIVSLMLMVGIFYWTVPELFISLDIALENPSNEKIIKLAVDLLAIAGIFQIVDSIRIITSASLRGLKDSAYPMWVAAISFWLIGLPLGLILGLLFHWGAVGIWMGLLCGIVINWILQERRLHQKIKTLSSAHD